MTGEPDGDFGAAIAYELAACRQRGIERLDVSSHNQSPVQTPVLQRLASEYVTARGLHVHGRISQLKYLFREAIEAFAAENEADAQLLEDLFFGDSINRVVKSAGELLDIARKKSGYSSEALFRQARRDALWSIAHFMPSFVEDAKRGETWRNQVETGSAASAAVLPQLRMASNDSVPDPEEQRHDAATGYVDNGEHFISLLAEATNATIVGFTNEKLASMLRVALDRKRAALDRPDACWDSLRVVFLSDKLLDLVNDERRDYSDPEEALKQRRLAAVRGRRTIKIFMQGLPPARWTTYESPYVLPLVGTLFEMPNRESIIQLLIRRSQRSATDHLYLQLEDTEGHYFSAAFEEIVHSSISLKQIVPVGLPAAERFRIIRTRDRQDALKDGSQATGWLPLVLAITWRMSGGRAEPLLQLRSHLTATRELDRLSHPSGHILDSDQMPRMLEFGLEDSVPLGAVRHRLQMETGEEDCGELRPFRTSRYLHPDKEHLFFFVYGCEFPQGFQLSRQAEMYPVLVHELLSIRENQVLRMTLRLCASPQIRGKIRADAFEIAALNLVLHGHPEVAEKLTTAVSSGDDAISRVVPAIHDLEEQTRQTWPGLERETVIMGLSGLQYREFFTLLLPFYASVGVLGAADHLQKINGSESTRVAVARLAELYHDESVMESIPLEL